MRAAETSDLPIWRALATCLGGAATSALGRPEEGIRQMADGLNQYEGLRTPPVFWPMIRFMQASAHVDAGTPEPGLELIDEASKPPMPTLQPGHARPRSGSSSLASTETFATGTVGDESDARTIAFSIAPGHP